MVDLPQFALRLDPRLPYWVDGSVSIFLGGTVALLSSPVTAMIGWSLPSAFILAIGLFLLPWGLFNLWTAQAPRTYRRAFTIHMLVDTVWVIGSAALLLIFGQEMTALGLAFVAAQGVAVAGVLVAKLAGARAHWVRG